VIVVTKFDNFYTESEAYSQISEEKIKEGVVWWTWQSPPSLAWSL